MITAEKTMRLPDTIPADAITIFYKAGRKEGEYHIWRRPVKDSDGETCLMWYWSAKGNSGIEYEVDDAKEAAKRWIRDSR